MRHSLPLLPLAALAALALFATATASHAQGLGGMLNQAKAKVSQATRAGASPSRAATAATQAAPGMDGELPAAPRDMSDVDAQDRYMRLVTANTRPFDPNDRSDDKASRELRYQDNINPRVGWDRPALAYFAGHNLDAWSFVQDICNSFHRGLGSTAGPYLKPHLQKVQVLRLTTTQQLPTDAERQNGGFVKSWDPATGTLSFAVCTNPGYQLMGPHSYYGDESEAHLENWIIKNVK